MTEIDSIEERELIRRSSVEWIEMAQLRAIDGGADDPVVLVLDLSDPWVRAVASAHPRRERVRQMIEKAPDPEGRPIIMFWGFRGGGPWRLARGGSTA